MRKTLLSALLLISASFSVQFLNGQACNAAFSFTANQNVVNFSASSNPQNSLHTWRFGDGHQGYGASISHTYSLPGTYTVTHIVTDSLNTCRDSVQQNITISFPVSCNAAFIAARDSFQLNHYTFFSTSVATGGTVQSYSWTINGTAVSTAAGFNYVFASGTYNVCLTITTTAGCTSSTCQSITVNVPASCNWTASFTATPSAGNPRQISFTANPAQATMRYLWNFGDAATSTQRNPVHTYNHAGTYSVKLIITDTLTSCYDTVRQDIQVHGSPADSCTASFTYTLNNYGNASFTAVSNQAITSQTWTIRSLHDSSVYVTFNTANPAYTFADTGYYLACLTLTTNTGCTRSNCQTIHVSTVNGFASGRLMSFPNPADGSEVKMWITITDPTLLSITVSNTSGNIVYRTQQQVMAGTQQITLPVQRLEKGMYYVDIRYNGQKKQSVFQKM